MYLCIRGHVFVCWRSCICVLDVTNLPLATPDFSIEFLKLFRQCGFVCNFISTSSREFSLTIPIWYSLSIT